MSTYLDLNVPVRLGRSESKQVKKLVVLSGPRQANIQASVLNSKHNSEYTCKRLFCSKDISVRWQHIQVGHYHVNLLDYSCLLCLSSPTPKQAAKKSIQEIKAAASCSPHTGLEHARCLLGKSKWMANASWEKYCKRYSNILSFTVQGDTSECTSGQTHLFTTVNCHCKSR